MGQKVWPILWPSKPTKSQYMGEGICGLLKHIRIPQYDVESVKNLVPAPRGESWTPLSEEPSVYRALGEPGPWAACYRKGGFMAMQKRILKQPLGHNMSHYFPSGYRRLWDSVVGYLEALFRILSREKKYGWTRPSSVGRLGRAVMEWNAWFQIEKAISLWRWNTVPMW